MRYKGLQYDDEVLADLLRSVVRLAKVDAKAGDPQAINWLDGRAEAPPYSPSSRPMKYHTQTKARQIVSA